MGLAASQARFLAITSRKANCEFQSMQLAQQKLSLARDMEKISDEYHDAINKTNLIWDPDGSGTSIYNLSYNIMMSPSELNNYMPYMLASRDGKIALDAKMAAAAKAAGIREDGFSGSDEDKFLLYQAFIGKMQDNKLISSVGQNMVYITNAGLGGQLYGRENGCYASITSLISYVDMVTQGAASGAYPNGSAYQKQAASLTFDFATYNSTGQRIGYDLANNWTELVGNKHVSAKGSAIMINGNYDNAAFTLADLLNLDITYLGKGQQNYNRIMDSLRSVLKNSADNGPFETLINNDVNVWYDSLNGTGSFNSLATHEKTMLTFIDQLGKGMYNLLMPENPSATDLNAFYMAMEDVISRLNNNSSLNNYKDLGGSGISEYNGKNAVQQAENFNCWVKRGDAWAISLSNLTEAFLTNFMNGRDGYTNGYAIYNDVKNSYYVTDDPGYLYQINSGEETNEELYKSEFYSIIFNNICQNGWRQSELVENDEYLQNAIKNGQLFVVSRGADNYFYQDRYIAIEGGHIMENTDNDAIASAEREYTSKKAKINIKEEELEIETKQLDAEIAALTTEYDTVKGLISKNIEKTFTLFNN